ncbi:MAG TPA: glycosyltransferase family 39 protein [bacterium]|nr:glycosyltransferase family 39 protein [bacterium]
MATEMSSIRRAPDGVRLPRAVVAGVALITLLRLAIALVLPLGDDETFYWEWSRHLAPGYLDQPPAIAWLIHGSTAVFGNTAFAVHFVAAVLLGITSLALWVLAREVLGRDDAATAAVVLFNVIPVFAAGGLLAVPDGPLGLAWVLTLLWSWRAANGANGHAWLYAGLWLGLALDSKYTAAVLPVSVALWLAAAPPYRRWLRRPEPYAALALAVLLFAPVVWWNATHHWASFYFTLAGRPGWSVGPNAPVFLGLEFVYLGPLLLPWLIWALAVAGRRGLAGNMGPFAPHQTGWLLLAAAGSPVIVGTAAASLVGAAKGHWAAPGYIAATIAFAALFTERPWPSRPRAWQVGVSAGIASAVLVTILTHALPVISGAVLPPRLDPTVDYFGWRAAAPAIAAVARRDAHRPFFITSDRYQVLAQFDFSTGGRYPAATVTGRDQYAYWTRWTDLRGHDGLFIQDGRYPRDVDLHQGCAAVEPGPSVPVVRRGVVVRTLDLVWCRDFQGRPIRPLR